MNEKEIKNSTAEHYDDFSELYENWSGESFGGYHFGIANSLKDLFQNDKMVNNLSNLVTDFFENQNIKNYSILDAGCGVGDVSYKINSQLNNVVVYGLTISSKQFEQSRKKYEQKDNVHIKVGDFENTNFQDGKFDVVFFIDSICHGTGTNKQKAITESYRILKKGGQLIICDVFLQKKEKYWSNWFKYVNNKVLDIWHVSEWGIESEILKTANEVGFVYDKEKILTWKIVPSVIHILITKIPWAFMKWIKNRKYKKELKYFCKLGLFAPLLGINPVFKYQVIMWKKK